MPSDEVVGKAIEFAPEGWGLIALSIVVVVAIILRWGVPVYKELREKRLEVERYRIEVDERTAQALDDRERDRIRNTAALVEQQRQNNENTKALTSIMTGLQARMEESASRSHEMGSAVTRIDSTTQHTDSLVEDIHNHLIGREGTD